MANVFQNITWITNESLRLLKNNLQFVRNINTDFESRFTETPRKGETIKVRKPSRYVGRSGETYTAEDHIEQTVDFTVQTTEGVDLDVANRELMFNLERFSERVLAPAMMTLANKIDRNCLALAYAATHNYVGAPGTVPASLKTYNQARALMSLEGAPQEGHTLLITPDMQVEAVDAGKSFFNPVAEIERQYETGLLGRHAGAKVYECQNLITHKVGPLGGTPLVNGAGQTGSNLVTDGWTASAALRLRKGDVIQIAGVYAVNPWTRQSTGKLRNFVVTADVSSDASGNATIPLSPAIVTSGPYQNVTAAPADNAAITVFGVAAAQQSTIANVDTPQGLRFHRDAFLFGSFEQPTPEGTMQARTVRDPDTGIVIRFIRDWDTKNNKQINRFDVVYAFGVAYPEFACRILS